MLLCSVTAVGQDPCAPEVTQDEEENNSSKPQPVPAKRDSGVSTYEIPRDDFLPEWKKSDRLLRFEKNDLYGYIDGGAELFLEFGFIELLVQKYVRDSAELTLEVYRMDSPAAALGIYLLRRGEETPIPGVGTRNSGSRWQLLAVKGHCFVQVNNFSGDSTLAPVMATLARTPLTSVPEGESVKLFDLLPRENLVPASERLIRGPYGLQPIFTFGEGDVLQLGGKIFGVVGEYRDSISGAFTRIMIEYPDSAAAMAAYRNLTAGLDSTLRPMIHTGDSMVFEDFQKKFGATKVRGRNIEAVVNLSRRPE